MTLRTTLAIETSCDDTSVAVVVTDNTKFWVEVMKSYSQVGDHQRYGGVVPELASRLHSEKILAVIDSIGWDAVAKSDSVSVTVEPGLPGSLLVGKSVAATLAYHYHKPLIKVNHIHGHILSLFLDRNLSDISLPLVVLSVSGWHNDLYLVDHYGGQTPSSDFFCLGNFAIKKLWGKLDDASGEAFDKVSRMLWGPNPWGQRVGKQAASYQGDSQSIFSRSFLSKSSFDFSFSWLKSQVARRVEILKNSNNSENTEDSPSSAWLTQQQVSMLAYEFQEAVVEVLGKKLIRAATAYHARSIGVVGGVSANTRLREYIQAYADDHLSNNVSFYVPASFSYCTDNAAMIGLVWLISS